MTDINRSEIILALKQVIIDDCDKDVAIDQIDENEQLIAGPLELDSLDALQICMTVKNLYGVLSRGHGGIQFFYISFYA